jgi:uncharacterized membrane protein
MKGDVLGFDPDSNTGAISGHDGQRYEFVRLEWRNPGQPRRGEVVDFIPDGPRATQVYPLATHYDPGEGNEANVVYILYLLNLLLPPITAIVGVIMAYVNRADAPEWVKTHYRFQIRTFWIALLYSVIGLLTTILVVGFFFLMFTLIWWVVRCVKGMQQISRGMPCENPATWLW